MIKIVNIELFQINPKLASRNANQKPRFSGIDTQTVYKVTTNNGIVGWGDHRGHSSMTPQEIDRFVDRSPFDFLNTDYAGGLMGALYDAMGKHLEIPAYKLFGQKVRDRVPVAAWTRPASPEDLAKEVQRAAAEGYLIFKMHTTDLYDVFEQNRAVEEVTPNGFKMHYDFNHNRPATAVFRIIDTLEKSPVVGFIEDPMFWQDVAGWRRLREQTKVPLLMHVPMLQGAEIVHNCADLYMIGELGIGTSVRRGFACAEARLSTVIQMTGGTLCKALALHLGAVIPNVSHSINLDDQYEEDVTGGRIEVADGSSPVPEGPGLGVEVDERELARIAQNPKTVIPRHIGKLRLPGGRVYHSIGFPSVSQVTGFLEGNVPGVYLDVWEEDNSTTWQETYDRIAKSGPFYA